MLSLGIIFLHFCLETIGTDERTTSILFIALDCLFGIVFVLKTKRSVFGISRSEVFSRKSVLKICSKFTGEIPCQSVISIKMLCNFIKIALRDWYSPVNLLHSCRAPFLKNTSTAASVYWCIVKLVLLLSRLFKGLVPNSFQCYLKL